MTFENTQNLFFNINSEIIESVQQYRKKLLSVSQGIFGEGILEWIKLLDLFSD